MKTAYRIGMVIAAMMLVIVCGGIGTAQTESDLEPVTIQKKAGIGEFLVGSRGRTLYTLKNDAPSKSTCYGECIKQWPSYCYKTDEISVGKGLKKSDFSWYQRDDGQEQLTYKGMPLYRYSGDINPDDVNGQGIKDVWFVVKP